MSSFSRSIQRGSARAIGFLVAKGKQAKQENTGKRMFCGNCRKTCDSWKELMWSAPDDKGRKTLLCRRCAINGVISPVVGLNPFEVPSDCPKHGLCLRPGQGGWSSHAQVARVPAGPEESKEEPLTACGVAESDAPIQPSVEVPAGK